MRPLLRAALVVVVALGAVACRSGGRAAPAQGPSVDMKPRDYRVVWTRGGKLGYVKTFAVSGEDGPTVSLHYVYDLDQHELGWVADDGQGERFVYPEQKIREAKRTVFERETLPVDALENQVKRILGIAASTEIALRTATEADVQR